MAVASFPSTTRPSAPPTRPRPASGSSPSPRRAPSSLANARCASPPSSLGCKVYARYPPPSMVVIIVRPFISHLTRGAPRGIPRDLVLSNLRSCWGWCDRRWAECRIRLGGGAAGRRRVLPHRWRGGRARARAAATGGRRLASGRLALGPGLGRLGRVHGASHGQPHHPAALFALHLPAPRPPSLPCASKTPDGKHETVRFKSRGGRRARCVPAELGEPFWPAGKLGA